MELSILVLFFLSGVFFTLLSRLYRDGVSGVFGSVVFVFAGLSVLLDGVLVYAGQNVTGSAGNLSYVSSFAPVSASGSFLTGFGVSLLLLGAWLGFVSAQLFGADDEAWDE